MQKGYSLDDLLPEAFSVVREVSKRVFNMRHFDVQLIGGIFLHKNCIVEMYTGEGKTLTATLSAYLNALSGNGVHIVTMNEYLANRDAKKNKFLFNLLGLTVGVNLSSMSITQKKKVYRSDIVYGTNYEFCFDYLRDNMIFSPENKVQRILNYALIDEVDSILIDEGRTPLILAGPSTENTEIYRIINNFVPQFVHNNKKYLGYQNKEAHFFINEKSKQIFLTELGLKKVESLLSNNKFIDKNKSLYSIQNFVLMQHIISALRAHFLFHRDVDYIVHNNKIIIVDEHTGRIMLDRRWSDGLHQAIEAKENVNILHENQTLASITLQNFFKMYKKLSGMTGTAITESFEFKMIYGLDTVVIPTNNKIIRKDFPDLIYITIKEKINAIIKDIKDCMLSKRPVLVGTNSIQQSEMISRKLHKLNITHKVLNAKSCQEEALIIAQAGRLGAVTISTNMAGRGTDIVLGGTMPCKSQFSCCLNYEKSKLMWKKEHDDVISVGGLHVIGTERNESRRIDNQLRGRSGRQGDPGSSRFYLSLEDSLVRTFIPKSVKKLFLKFNIKFGESIEHHWITNAISYAQKKIEDHNFMIRKTLLEYDDILNIQRNIFYSIRENILNTTHVKYIIKSYLLTSIKDIVNMYCIFESPVESWDIFSMKKIFKNDFNIVFPFDVWIRNNYVISNTDVVHKIYKKIRIYYQKIENIIGCKNIRIMEKNIFLGVLDFFWKEHLAFMEYLRQGIHFRGYAQKNPKQEYVKESFIIFYKMLNTLQYEISSNVIKKIFFLY
nr:preprotein translocase subunit SecA [Buchnera aphidicola]